MNLPNKLTVFRIFLIPVFMLIIIFGGNAHTTVGNFTVVWSWVIAAIVFAVASATDWFDGHIARSRNLVTNFGKFADPLADKMLVMSAFIMLVGLDLAPAWISAIIICRELAVTGLRLLLVETGGEVLAAAMPGKIKTATQMFSIIFLLCHFEPWGTILLYISLFFTLYSGYDYFKGAGFLFKDTFK